MVLTTECAFYATTAKTAQRGGAERAVVMVHCLYICEHEVINHAKKSHEGLDTFCRKGKPTGILDGGSL